MKKTMYRLQLRVDAPKSAQAIILLAAQSNYCDIPTSLVELAEYGRGYSSQSDSPKSQFELIGENKLHIDSLINGEWENVAIIEEIEVLELEQTNDEELELNPIFPQSEK